MKKYTGHCHCGSVQYEFSADIEKVFSCNCSHCAVKAFILAFVPKEQFQITAGEDNLTQYRFNKKNLAHMFCKTCGVQCFSFGADPEGKATAAINLRTVPDLETAGLPHQEFNGKEW